ncbi:hypothetical protein [Candidatus Palauibacter sp.]|uniref:hypothetical protein n=1 Tax=Candidatus Palauibacter sp. TaxID=3101350 RepID=UPI003B022A79
MAAAIEVLTPLGAANLFTKTPEAIRQATALGHVRTRLILSLQRDTRLIDLESARAYWGRDRVDPSQLQQARAVAPVLEVVVGRYPDGKPADRERFRVLHVPGVIPWVLEPTCNHGPDRRDKFPCTEDGCSPVWFRWGRGVSDG